jgi:hypothetical protein
MAQPQPHHADFAKFASEELYKLCLDRRTGTLYIVTITSLLAQFGLSNGEITFLSVQNKHGLEALEALEALLKQGASVGTSRFADGHVPSFKMALPPTGQILDLLGKRVGPSPREADPRSGRMTEQTKKIVEEELVELIGPIAVILCDDAWSSAASLDTVLEALSRELPDPDQAARFRQNVLKRLS